MCSKGGQIAQNDKDLQAAQTKMTNTLNADYSTTFAEQQKLLGQQTARLNAIAANPMGYTTAQLHSATTNINENTSRAAKQALGSAAAFAAAHGAADVGGGGIGQIAGEIGSEAAQSKAGQLSQLSQQNEGLKQQNFWSALSGLNSVGSELSGAGGTAISGAGNAANSAVNAGSGALAAQQAGWQNFAGVLGGISGLATAASGFPALGGSGPKGCWVAAAIYGGWDDPRTILVRSYIFGDFSTTWYGSLVARLYSKIGKSVATHPWAVRMLTPLFNLALRKAKKSS